MRGSGARRGGPEQCADQPTRRVTGGFERTQAAVQVWRVWAAIVPPAILVVRELASRGAGNVSPAKIGSMPHRDIAVRRDVLDRFGGRLVRLPNRRSAEAGAGGCVDLIAAGVVAAG